jgi:hypothetical protein
MPKELAHFTVALRTARLLGDTPFGLAAKHHDASLLLGSVFHDAWFYLTGTKPGRLGKLADELHGAHGEDTFWLLERQAETAREARLAGEEHAQRAGTAASLLVGMASHLCADVALHPLVYYHSGNYYTDKKAVERHRRLETLLDMALDATGEAVNVNPRIASMLRTVRLPGAFPRDALAERAEISPEALASELKDALQVFALVQRHTQSSSQARLAWLLRPLLPQGARDFAALFYAPQLKRHLPLVRGPISWRHPVTGEERTATLDQLLGEAAESAAGLLRRMEPFVFGEAPAPGWRASGMVGPSLDTGLPGVGADQATHFAPAPLPPR